MFLAHRNTNRSLHGIEISQQFKTQGMLVCMYVMVPPPYILIGIKNHDQRFLLGGWSSAVHFQLRGSCCYFAVYSQGDVFQHLAMMCFCIIEGWERKPRPSTVVCSHRCTHSQKLNAHRCTHSHACSQYRNKSRCTCCLDGRYRFYFRSRACVGEDRAVDLDKEVNTKKVKQLSGDFRRCLVVRLVGGGHC